jgi:hypothetical protein
MQDGSIFTLSNLAWSARRFRRRAPEVGRHVLIDLPNAGIMSHDGERARFIYRSEIRSIDSLRTTNRVCVLSQDDREATCDDGDNKALGRDANSTAFQFCRKDDDALSLFEEQYRLPSSRNFTQIKQCSLPGSEKNGFALASYFACSAFSPLLMRFKEERFSPIRRWKETFLGFCILARSS